MARASSWSKRRRFGISSRKWVSAEADSSSIRLEAAASSARSLRMVALSRLVASAEPDAVRLRGFATAFAGVRTRFFMGMWADGYVSRLAGLNQDRIVQSRYLATSFRPR